MTTPQFLIQLVHIEGPFKGEIREFSDLPISIGRGPLCHLRFPSDLNYVSRNHAKIDLVGNRFRLIDQSMNGTFLNGKLITEFFLKSGDVIMFCKDGPSVIFLIKVMNGKLVAGESTSIINPDISTAPAPNTTSKFEKEFSETIVLPAESDWDVILKREIKRLPFGQIAFNPPQVMKVAKTERVEVSISQNREIDITKTLKGRGIPEVIIAKVGPFMKAKLSGGGFEITSLSEEVQFVTSDDTSLWSWDVMPLKSGNKTLHLQVSIRLKLPFGEERKDHPIIDKQVRVRVNPVHSIKSFISKNWKWILTALIIPLIGWTIKLLIK